MKKKNVLMMALSLALVAVIAVGGTLAYLTADTGTLTNTFEFTTKNIALKLEETAYKADSSSFYGYNVEGIGDASSKTVNATGTDDGITYTDIVPGAQISKEPKLTVVADSVDCYVYALVTGVTDTQSDTSFWTVFNTEKWTKVDVGDDYTYIPEGATLLRYSTEVASQSSDRALEKLFDTVYMGTQLTKGATEKIGEIEIRGYAVQADAFTTTTPVDTEAMKYFNGVYTPVGD